MHRLSAILVLTTAFLALLPTQGADQAGAGGGATPEGLDFFETRIRPVLVRECYECHSAGSKAVKGGLRLDTREATLAGGDSGPALVPGSPGESPLLTAIKYDDLRMPPKRKLSDEVAADFERWIRMGAPDPRGGETARPAAKSRAVSDELWSLKPAVRPVPPQVVNAAWVRDELDRFVLAGLERNALTPAAAADRRTWLRRVSFDLTGLPPSPEVVARFEADTSENAYEKIVDGLLASPRFGERWGRHWLDLARYAEDQAHTFKARMYPNGYLYRDWVVRAINEDMPYDRFLKYQIAGDLMDGSAAYANRAALGLISLGPVYYQDNGEKDKALADEWDDRLDTLMRGTQALTVACARCHDHKYDPVTMADYYGLAGVFASTDYAELPAVPDAVVVARQQADMAVADAELVLNRLLAGFAPSAREKLVDRIPDYALTAWKLVREAKGGEPKEKAVRDAAAASGLSRALLARWAQRLAAGSAESKAGQPGLPGRSLADFRSKYASKGDNPTAEAELRQLAADLVSQAGAALPGRQALLAEFGEDFAFLKPADRAKVERGVIPLGNLFDDRKETTLATALASDRFLAVASKESLGVAQLLQGWGESAPIVPGIRVNFAPLGSDGNAHGQIVNDGWSAEGGIRTIGQSADPGLGRTEQGIGMHANALITFDLGAIRQAGLIPGTKRMRFLIDRAGLNDDSLGQGEGVNIAVIVSKPQADRSRFDSILSAHVNGRPVQLVEDDTVYKFRGEMPPKLKADGKYASFDIDLPPEAQYVTIVSTAAGKPGDANSISSDHAVISGARIVFEPEPAPEFAANGSNAAIERDEMGKSQRLARALLLSELFDEQGLLGIPAREIEPLLEGEPARRAKAQVEKVAALKRAASAIDVPKAHTLTEGTVRDSKIYLAGDPKRTGAVAPRRFPAAIGGFSGGAFPDSASGRLELAGAIASPANPLTARVIVNRVWAGYFGKGLVRTLNNFGQLGDRPSHPELLDYLASELVDSGWSLKGLHRRIVLSAAYRQSSRAENGSAREIDPENRLLWRMNRKRLEIEPWRDAVLAISGEIDSRVGGPSAPLDDANRRRTLYGYVSRHRLNDLLRLFDFPDPNITAGERSVTTVPLQQLFVLNSDFMVRQSKALAARLERESTATPGRIDRAFRLTCGRGPSSTELAAAEEFLNARPDGGSDKLTPLEQFCLALLGINEMTYLD